MATNEFPYGVTRGDGYLVIVGDEDAIRQHEAEVVESKLNDNDPTDDASYRMIRDMGGLTEYHKFLDRADPDEISALKAAYGVEWRDKFEGTMLKCSNDGRVFGGYYKVEPVYTWGSSLRPNQLKVSMRTWTLTSPQNMARFAEFYIHNAPSDWHDGHARKAGREWAKAFDFCRPAP